MSVIGQQGAEMKDEDVLMGMEMTARAEREIGFTGWGKPPESLLPACHRLVLEGLAEECKGHVGWFRPTTKGAARVGHRITRAQ